MSVSIPGPPRGEDLPCDDGEPMETWRHRAQMNLLVDSLDEEWRDRSDYYAAGNMNLYFSETQALRNDFRAPDVFIVLDTHRHERKRWVVWEEDGRMPDVVIEITSESTEHVDRGEKMNLYARVLKVSFYAIYDPFTARLDAYRLTEAREYEPIPAQDGLVPCAPLGLSLGVTTREHKHVIAPWLHWFRPDGSRVPDDRERAALAAERAALAAERAALAAERAAHEAERAAHEAERAAREEERAAHEAERANRAEAELARLREELEKR